MMITTSDSASAVAIKHQLYQLRYQLRNEQPYIKNARRQDILRQQLDQVAKLIAGIEKIEQLQDDKRRLL